MIIGVPKEIKDNENRIAITPAGVKAFKDDGHEVLVQTNGGVGSGISDEEYIQAGAEMVDSPAEIFERADMVMKVKEPLEEEYKYFKKDLILFTYLHLAAEERLTKELMAEEVVSIAYETVEDSAGGLPLLTPMSEVAGRLSTQAGARFLEKPQGGQGVLLGGIPGVAPAKVVVIGGGIVGLNATKMAVGLGADVTVMEKSAAQMRYIDDIYQGRVKTMMSNEYNLAEQVAEADLVIGAVLIPGAKAPHLVTEDMVKTMKKGSVIADVAIDQGGCVETSHATTHSDPVFEKHGVVHYCVANMPGAVARTSTFGLTNATLPYARKLANKGYKQALKDDIGFALGLNVYQGEITYKAVADAFGMDYTPIEEVIDSF
ncbi:MAG: alanine dehydrogenase [Bacillota bacterium]